LHVFNCGLKFQVFCFTFSVEDLFLVFVFGSPTASGPGGGLLVLSLCTGSLEAGAGLILFFNAAAEVIAAAAGSSIAGAVIFSSPGTAHGSATYPPKIS
jgi:hypothetical protein